MIKEIQIIEILNDKLMLEEEGINEEMELLEGCLLEEQNK